MSNLQNLLQAEADMNLCVLSGRNVSHFRILASNFGARTTNDLLQSISLSLPGDKRRGVIAVEAGGSLYLSTLRILESGSLWTDLNKIYVPLSLSEYRVSVKDIMVRVGEDWFWSSKNLQDGYGYAPLQVILNFLECDITEAEFRALATTAKERLDEIEELRKTLGIAEGFARSRGDRIEQLQGEVRALKEQCETLTQQAGKNREKLTQYRNAILEARANFPEAEVFIFWRYHWWGARNLLRERLVSMAGILCQIP